MSFSDDSSSKSPIFDTSTESGTNSKVTSSSEETDSIKEKLAKKETKAVFRLRVLVILILLCAAVSVSVVVYLITKFAEEDEFEASYDGTIVKVLDSFEAIADKIATISSVGISAVVHGLDQNQSWPFNTLTHFQQRTSTARLLSGSLYITMSPYVTEENRDQWERYSAGDAGQWAEEAHKYQTEMGVNDFEFEFDEVTSNAKSKPIFFYDNHGDPVIDPGPGPYLPVWQSSPVVGKQLINENLFRRPAVQTQVTRCFENKAVIIGGMEAAPPGESSSKNIETALFATLTSIYEKKQVPYPGDPMARLYLPIFDNFKDDRTTVGVLMSIINWRFYFRGILPDNVNGIIVVLENTCEGNFTYELRGKEAHVLGFGDLHDRTFDSYERYATFKDNLRIADGTTGGLPLDQSKCMYSVHVFPSHEFYNVYNTKMPILITFAVALVFMFTGCMFLVYDRLVERRQRIVLQKAAQTTAIVSSLFPKAVRDKLLADDNLAKGGNLVSANHRLKTFLSGDGTTTGMGTKQIADLFPYCTVMFADIAGFTAWSSTREPEQVFILLQTVYAAFDAIAKRRKVFKVETIGDCYVAVTGLPEPQANHAVIMARFAWECRIKMNELTKELVVVLGPDTGDLSMRFGMHSGSVTAGVLRGDRARFQLFGDTVNTAARMEHTGTRDKIQITKATADLLITANKGHWVRPREEQVQAKGKGTLHTFWLSPGTKKANSNAGSSDTNTCSSDEAIGKRNEEALAEALAEAAIRQDRLVDWMVEILLEHVRKIVAKRDASTFTMDTAKLTYEAPAGVTCLDEVKEVIVLPKFNLKTASETECHSGIKITPAIIAELRDFVTTIATLYLDNPFHNFEHACHVTMSVNKLLSRIVAPEMNAEDTALSAAQGENETKAAAQDRNGQYASHLHDYTFGINSDPLCSFAMVWSALIHDVDHRGCSNVQMQKEEKALSKRYRNQSVLEQNSLDVAWGLLMSERFSVFRSYVFGSQEEMERFRQVIVNVVMATDIFDKQMNDKRKDRWNRAFTDAGMWMGERLIDLKCTIVLEHIIQASDVAHTMQHWTIYRKWNKRLFKEMYLAYRNGRMAIDPTTFWYKGEMGFFDNYVIPLAKKLAECGVFGVSSDEYLKYAQDNRAEWEAGGMEIVEEVLEEMKELEELKGKAMPAETPTA